MTTATPRRTAPDEMRSHEDIYNLITDAAAKARDAVHRADMLTEVVQRVETKLDSLIKAVGEEREDERGERVGTGVVGRMMRVETTVSKRFTQYDGWVKLVVGFTAGAMFLIPVVWWLVSGKAEALLK